MTPVELTLTVAVLLIGGVAKGAIGFGLPAIVVPLLSLFVGPLEAVVIVSIPAMLTNLANVRIGISEWRSVFRIWPYLLTGVMTIPFGVLFLQTGNPDLVRLIIGLALYGYLVLRRRLPAIGELRPATRSGIGAGMGVIAGFLGGMASLPGPVNIVYFSMFNFSKDTFVFLINVFNSVNSIGLVGTMAYRGIFTTPALLRGVGALIPIFLGFGIGLWLRKKLSQELFYRLVNTGLFAIATLLILRSLWKLFL